MLGNVGLSHTIQHEQPAGTGCERTHPNNGTSSKRISHATLDVMLAVLLLPVMDIYLRDSRRATCKNLSESKLNQKWERVNVLRRASRCLEFSDSRRGFCVYGVRPLARSPGT